MLKTPSDHPESRGKYIFAAGEAAAERLRLLDRIFHPTTRALLTRAGLAPGWQVADIGCGIGLNAMWMAERVGPSGAVAGIDMSEEQMRIARAKAEAAGVKNTLFRQGTATATGLPRGAFDLVYARFLLCHLTNPVAALEEMSSLLKSGGVLVCEDFIASTIATYPETRAYVRLSEIYPIMDAKRGVDSNAGAKLHQYFQSAGFSAPEIKMEQPVFLRGEEKRFWEMTLREAIPAIVEAGVAREEDIEQICEEMRAIAEDETILLVVTTVVQAWARK
ncbi:MAG: methyltransferase domain-containing protein [Candidatus Acidiferrales bacterium]